MRKCLITEKEYNFLKESENDSKKIKRINLSGIFTATFRRKTVTGKVGTHYDGNDLSIPTKKEASDILSKEVKTRANCKKNVGTTIWYIWLAVNGEKTTLLDGDYIYGYHEEDKSELLKNIKIKISDVHCSAEYNKRTWGVQAKIGTYNPNSSKELGETEIF